MVPVPLKPLKDVMRTFVIFYKLNPAFVMYEDGVDEDEVLMRVSNSFGIAPKFLEAMEKGVNLNS